MKRIPLHRILVLAVAMMAQAMFSLGPVQAQSSGSYSTGGSQNFALPGFSSMGGKRDSATLFNADFNSNLGFDLGCGGVGLFDFMQASFDLGNIVDEFKSSLSTSLSKALVTFAMSSPQIASLFDTLNAFGNARFDMFQQSCDIGAIREEVRGQVQDKCVERKKASGSSPAAAQAACANKVDPDDANTVTAEFAKTVRQSENIPELLRGAMCGGGGTYNASKQGCFIMGFLPQFRLCLRSSIGESCPTDGYGGRESPISIAGMADATTAAAARFLDPVAQANTSPEMMAIPDAVANQAALATQMRVQNGDKPKTSTTTSQKTFDESTQKLLDDFRAQLACPKDSKAFDTPLMYIEELAKMGYKVPTINTEVDLTPIQNALGEQIMGALSDAYAKDIEGVKEMLRIGVICMINRSGEMDPILNRLISKTRDPADGVSFRQGMARKIGHQLAIEIGTFLKSMIRNGIVQLNVKKATAPALADSAAQTEAGIADDQQTQHQVDMQEEAIAKPAREAANAMITKIDAMMADEQRRYDIDKEQLKDNRLLHSMANGIYMDTRAQVRGRGPR